jgi:hypothetical protein
MHSIHFTEKNWYKKKQQKNICTPDILLKNTKIEVVAYFSAHMYGHAHTQTQSV